MNFLAHCHLSGKNEELLVGNFMADFLKGKPSYNLPTEVLRGIELHHAIDQFTDKHPLVKQGYQRLRPQYGRYAAVIMDVFYDHLLAVNWELFHEQHLSDFAQWVYAVFQAHQDLFPPRAQRILPSMIKYDWLSNYTGTYGIERALEGLSRRASFENRMDEALEALLRDFNIFNEEFLIFFPEILTHVQPFWTSSPNPNDAV